jgi:alpha-ketoglutarate-dependent 2,4-dichlorophenoxyacetate dioxygenase
MFHPPPEDDRWQNKDRAMRLIVTPLQPLHPEFGAELSGVDFETERGPAIVKEFVAAMDRYGVCCYRPGKPMSDAAHIALGKALGPIDTTPVFKIAGRGKSRIAPELNDVANIDENDEVMKEGSRVILFRRGDRLWHTDMSFHPVRAVYSLLSAHEIPPQGGDTEFADLRAAHDALPDGTKRRIENLVAVHSIWHSRASAGFPDPTEEELASRPPARHRLVQTHPGSGRKTLYMASHASHIEGWPLDEGRALLKELKEFATEARFIYRHRWRLGDLVIWDNRCTMHRGTPYEDTHFRRDMRRATTREMAVPA